MHAGIGGRRRKPGRPDQAAASRRLERRARTRTIALGFAVLALAIVGGYAVLGANGGRRAPVALLYNGDGVFAASRIVEHGFDTGVSDFALTPRKTSVSSGDEADLALRQLSRDGVGLIVVGAVDTVIDPVAAAFPDTRYVVIDLPATQPNVIHLAFADNEGSFLAGVAAAATTRTGTIGFIGGMDGPVIWPFQAGYEAGARAVNPSIRILSVYLAPAGDVDGFLAPGAAKVAAAAQYQAGADVVFAAAGDSGLGVFGAAADGSAAAGRQLWAIGVDSDQYQTIGDNPANVDWQAWQPHILTSMIKHMDMGVYAVLSDYARGKAISSTRTLDLAAGGVDVSYSGGFIDDLEPLIESWRAKIVAGSVAVPCMPAERAAQASPVGSQMTGCGG